MTGLPHASWAEAYDLIYAKTFPAFYNGLTNQTLSLMDTRFSCLPDIVDFGAGTGRLSIPLAQRGHKVTAVDPCREMLDQLRRKDSKNSVQTVCSKMEDFKPGKKYDIALCVFTVIIYLLDENVLKKSLLAVRNALKPHGMLLIDIPHRALFQNRSYNTACIKRKVVITGRNNDIYQYHENSTIKQSGIEKNYSDTFKIKYWPPAVMRKALKSAGFSLEDDVTHLFPGAGADYWIMRSKS